MSLFLRVLCGFSRFNDSFRGSHKVNVFKLTVIELLTYLPGFFKHFVILCHVSAPWLLLSTIPSPSHSLRCPKRSTPTRPFYPELWASPWEVIYNATGVTIIRLHTISLCPLCFDRLLWVTFLFPLKHIVQPSTVQHQPGCLPMSKITSLINIWSTFVGALVAKLL